MVTELAIAWHDEKFKSVCFILTIHSLIRTSLEPLTSQKPHPAMISTTFVYIIAERGVLD